MSAHRGSESCSDLCNVIFNAVRRSPKWYDPENDKEADALITGLTGHEYTIASTHQSTSDALERVMSLLGQGLKRRAGVLGGRRGQLDLALPSATRQPNHPQPFTVVFLHQYMWVSSEGRLKTYSCARRNDSPNNKKEVIAEVRSGTVHAGPRRNAHLREDDVLSDTAQPLTARHLLTRHDTTPCTGRVVQSSGRGGGHSPPRLPSPHEGERSWPPRRAGAGVPCAGREVPDGARREGEPKPPHGRGECSDHVAAPARGRPAQVTANTVHPRPAQVRTYCPPIVAIVFETFAVPGGGHWMGKNTAALLKSLQGKYGTILIEDAAMAAFR